MAGFVSLTDVFVQITQGTVRDAEQANDLYRRWLDDIAPGADGWLSLTAGVTEDDDIIAVTRFASELAARANSQRSEQTRWWDELNQQLVTPLVIHHCMAVATFGESRPDNPGFVQVVQGTTPGLSEVMERVAETEQHNIYEHYLDVIGGLIADHGDGGFSELIFYPSDE
ncbi:MAG: hypothetical protein M3276_11180, partial [Actinomycetota bacterium]|nr:hypothetical protein [Actinomycetota bacterium]